MVSSCMKLDEEYRSRDSGGVSASGLHSLSSHRIMTFTAWLGYTPRLLSPDIIGTVSGASVSEVKPADVLSGAPNDSPSFAQRRGMAFGMRRGICD
ncbi:hypothetical protein JZ751_011768, partial [Albula glossodonta]